MSEEKALAKYQPTGAISGWQIPADIEKAKELAAWLAHHGRNAIPRAYQGDPGAIMVAMGVGDAYGLSPIMSLQRLHVVHGKVGMDATEMRGRAMMHPDCEYFLIVEATPEIASIRVRRKSWPAGEESIVEVKIEDAKRAKWGMSGGSWAADSSWAKTPDDMLVARATAKACRRAFPEIFSGILEAGEVRDVIEVEASVLPAAPTKEEGLTRRLGAALREEQTIEIGGSPAAETEPAARREAVSETPDPEPEPEAAESQARAIPLMIGALLHSLQVDGLLKTCEDYGVAHKKSMKKEDLVAAIEAHIETFGEKPEEDAEPEPAPSTIQTGASPAGPDPDEQRRIESGETFGYYRDKLEECADLETYEKIKAEASKPSIAGQLIATDRQVLKQLFAEKFAELGGND